MSIPQILYLYLLALVLAFLEVQVEGQHGWAAQLPTWRPHEHRWYARAYRKFMGGKEMTGYHVAVFLFSFLMLHLPYVWGLRWHLAGELQTLSLFFLFIGVWVFLWFVINPHFGIRKLSAGHISWHKTWVLGLPIDYYVSLILSLLFFAGSVGFGHLAPWFVALDINLVLLACTVALGEVVKWVLKRP